MKFGRRYFLRGLGSLAAAWMVKPKLPKLEDPPEKDCKIETIIDGKDEFLERCNDTLEALDKLEPLRNCWPMSCSACNINQCTNSCPHYDKRPVGSVRDKDGYLIECPVNCLEDCEYCWRYPCDKGRPKHAITLYQEENDNVEQTFYDEDEKWPVSCNACDRYACVKGCPRHATNPYRMAFTYGDTFRSLEEQQEKRNKQNGD